MYTVYIYTILCNIAYIYIYVHTYYVWLNCLMMHPSDIKLVMSLILAALWSLTFFSTHLPIYQACSSAI